MLFNEIIGQQEVKKRLAELVQHNRLSHALLFIGKEGVGALPLAIALSQYVVCEKVSRQWSVIDKLPERSLFGDDPHSALVTPHSSEDACAVCPACSKAQELVHPDIHFS